MSEKKIGVCLLGCGVIGSGVANLLTDHADAIAARTGLRFELRHVVDKDASRPGRNYHGAIEPDAEKAIDDPNSQVVIELIGGIDGAGRFVERALRLGKPVVTANKSLLAARGPALFALARQFNTCIAFEASCAGGIPIIHALMHGLVANRIDALVGIVNGTCNFILTQMTRNGWSYGQALAEAQKAGFAEADPTLDVSGRDAAQKLAILSGLAFNFRVDEPAVQTEGIATLDAADIKFAGELGYVIKLLAIAQRHGQRVSLRVHPTLVPKTEMLADVSGSFNAVSIWGHAIGHTMFYGRGAGQRPTASAVVADLVHVALGLTPLAFKQLRMLSDQVPAAPLLPSAELSSRYYLRLTVRDEPGVLAQVTKILGDRGISLSAILQHEADNGQTVPVIILTHQANEGAVQASRAEIDQLPSIQSPTVCLRILDPPVEFAEA